MTSRAVCILLDFCTVPGGHNTCFVICHSLCTLRPCLVVSCLSQPCSIRAVSARISTSLSKFFVPHIFVTMQAEV